ncbi:MAG: hypothetical protein NZ899_11945 [Thermoguttaceae bacterium]|nr:hypothetical protein [Thermoguttaceae bacterium]MDW8079083.1 hypothetical protein [Thermoguttaceae bacterium]
MLTPREVLDQAFLDVRSMLLEIAATLDRYDDAKGRLVGGERYQAGEDKRLQTIYQALQILGQRQPGRYRTELILELFSSTEEEKA